MYRYITIICIYIYIHIDEPSQSLAPLACHGTSRVPTRHGDEGITAAAAQRNVPRQRLEPKKQRQMQFVSCGLHVVYLWFNMVNI